MERQYPVFSAWEKDAIRTEFGLVFAPEDLYYIDSRGRRWEFFAGDEALELERKLLKPSGWRLPTRDDWANVSRTLRTSERIRSDLSLQSKGFIHPDDWKAYKSQSKVVSPLRQGVRGYYWSSTQHGSCSSFFLRITMPKGIKTTDYCYWAEGLSIRCVRN